MAGDATREKAMKLKISVFFLAAIVAAATMTQATMAQTCGPTTKQRAAHAGVVAILGAIIGAVASPQHRYSGAAIGAGAGAVLGAITARNKKCVAPRLYSQYDHAIAPASKPGEIIQLAQIAGASQQSLDPVLAQGLSDIGFEFSDPTLIGRFGRQAHPPAIFRIVYISVRQIGGGYGAGGSGFSLASFATSGSQFSEEGEFEVSVTMVNPVTGVVDPRRSAERRVGFVLYQGGGGYVAIRSYNNWGNRSYFRGDPSTAAVRAAVTALFQLPPPAAIAKKK